MDQNGLKKGRLSLPTATLETLALYDLCVQNAPAAVRFIDAVRSNDKRKPARSLREDFSGGGGLSLAWIGSHHARAATAVDHDPKVLERLNGKGRIRTVDSDVRRCPAKADVIAATNFPLGYFHDRKSLVAYLTLCRKRLLVGGCFVADMYGGPSAFQTGTQKQKFKKQDGTPVVYEFEQREADALTGMVTNALHFTVGRGSNAKTFRDAFVYHWRLWSVPELGEACREAGFSRIEFYDFEGGAVDDDGRFHARSIEHGAELGADWVVYVVASGGRSRRSPSPKR